jgi:anti-sigma B factor antagonist
LAHAKSLAGAKTSKQRVAMAKADIIDVQFLESELVVSPNPKLINHRKTAKQLSKAIQRAFQQHDGEGVRRVVLNMEDVSWISSAGLNELIRLQSLSRSHGLRLRLKSLSETLQDVFRITRLERTFDCDGMSSFPS